MKPGALFLVLLLPLAGVSAASCEYEKRPIGPDRPLSPPTGPADPRIRFYDKNAWQMSTGGRLFTWYGCGDCHDVNARFPLNLRGGRPVDLVTTYQAIANGAPPAMPAYANRMPSESIWQIAAYVRSLRTLKDTKRARTDLDQKAEPSGTTWKGAIQ